MRIGLDFDNTIVSYDAIFHKVALERSLIPSGVLPTKLAVREHLRGAGKEDAWTEMQGHVYGTRMAEVDAYPGVLDFLRWAREQAIDVSIISHKTRHPFIGPAHDLHAAARSWIETQCIRPGLVDERQVFLELTKPEKIARIRSTGCDYYIDDLPEILLADDFPRETSGILFDPDGHHADSPAFTRLRSWSDILQHFQLIGEVAHLLGVRGSLRLEPRGGGNNRVYVLSTRQGARYVVKEYFRDPSDPRDRLGAEQAFLRYADALGIDCVPKVAASSTEHGLGIYEYIEGRPVAQVSAAYVQQAADFFLKLNASKGQELPPASEACFSIEQHFAMVDKRIARLSHIPGTGAVEQAAREFVAELASAWSGIKRRVARQAGNVADEVEDTCVSPSDFGFHNALVRPSGELCFLDFEYAGRDDPAKMVGDFFSHPGIPVPPQYFDEFVERTMSFSPASKALAARARLLRPVFQVKWCCIILNEFLRDDARRRAFADPAADLAARKQRQLSKAKALLTEIHA